MAPKQDPKPKFQEGECGPWERHLTAAGRARRGGGAGWPSGALCGGALRRGLGAARGGRFVRRRRSAGAAEPPSACGVRGRRRGKKRGREGRAPWRRCGGEGRGPAVGGQRPALGAAWSPGRRRRVEVPSRGGAGGALGPGSRAVKWPPQDGRRRLPAPTSAGRRRRRLCAAWRQRFAGRPDGGRVRARGAAAREKMLPSRGCRVGRPVGVNPCACASSLKYRSRRG